MDGRARGGREVKTIGDAILATFRGPPSTALRCARAVNADKLDGQDAAQVSTAAIRFAAVASDGTLAAGRGAAGATRTGDGTYQVAFTAPVSGCALQATETTITDAGAVAVEAVDATTLAVRTRAGGGAGGTGTTDPANRPFHLVVLC